MSDTTEKPPVDARYTAALQAQADAKALAQKAPRRRPLLRLVWNRDEADRAEQPTC